MSIGYYYLEWLTSHCFPVVILIAAVVLNKWMKKKISAASHSEEDVVFWTKRRLAFRRLILLYGGIMYTPMAMTAARSFACASSFDAHMNIDMVMNQTEVFLYDQTQTCDTFIFQTINFLSTFSLVVVGGMLPAGLIFLSLRLKKFRWLNDKFSLHGYVYEPYIKMFCYWEAIPLIRKLTYVLVVEIYRVPSLISSCVYLGLTLLYMIIIISARPYRKCTWKKFQNIKLVEIHNGFELLSNLSIAFLQVRALLGVLIAVPSYIDLAVIIFIGVVLVVWLTIFCLISLEEKLQEDNVYTFSIEPPPKTRKKFVFWRRNKLGEGVTDMELEQRQQALDF